MRRVDMVGGSLGGMGPSDGEASLSSPRMPASHRLHFFLADSTGALNFERPCYLRGGICLKRGTPNCEPFHGPCRAFTICCRIKRNQ